jgi:hypothetical protein
MSLCKYISVLCLLLLIACSNPTKQKEQVKSASLPSKVFNDYRQIPLYIRSYLDSIEGGKFLISNPGDRWEAGCNRAEGEADKQLISATLNNEKFTMSYWQGGWGVHQRTILLQIKDSKVIPYKFSAN